MTNKHTPKRFRTNFCAEPLNTGRLLGARYTETGREGDRLRLDKFLKVSRLIKRRTVANEACDNERVTVGGKPAKASYEVKVGDVIEIRFGERRLRVEVLAVSEHASKADAASLYRELPST